jgi:Ca-activated chloride channel homolog
MKIDTNDPQWTAYALGEITDERERAEIESILKESAEMRQLVAEIRETAGLLTTELQAEPAINLTQDQRDRIEAKAQTGRTWFGLKPAWAMAIAAAAIMMISIVAVKELRQLDPNPPQNQVAMVLPKKPAPDQEPKSPAVPATLPADSAAVKRAADTEVVANKAVIPEKLKVAAIPQQAASLGKKLETIVPASASQQTYEPAPPQFLQHAMLSGTVKDGSGAVLPGASLTLTDKATGSTTHAVSNANGQYSFPSLRPGLHKLSAELPGFQMQTYTDIALNAASPAKLDFTLPIASSQQRVEVSALVENMLLESSSSAGAMSPEKKIAELPLVNSNAQSLIKAMSGVTSTKNPVFGADSTQFAGISASNLNVQRDGITISDARYVHPKPPFPPHRGMLPPWQRQRSNFNTETYDNISDNAFLDALQNPLSTFSIDVDTASYSNMRRFLDGGSLPPKDSIRIEELVNYFDYDYKGPKNEKPFAANFEITDAPWNPEHRLLRIGLKGREIAPGKRPNSNLVFLLDVSGSMEDWNKLPLVKEAMTLLMDQLTEADRVAIVVYASDTSLYLPSTRGDQKERLRQAIYRLHAGGSTNGASGIQLAYQTARENFIPGGVNRVILATDGDFNVGITNRGDLTRLIEEKAKSGIFLSALGFGMGNYKDATLETLASKGRGNYAYIDNLNEAKKVLVEQINSTLVSIAKDVKIQVEFNPQRVSAYRLIGYEDRVMAKEDFNNDAKQAGVIGAGHAVTVLYELVPAGAAELKPAVDPLKYQKPAPPSSNANSDELLTVKIRSKEPEKDTSVLSEFPVKESKEKFSNASQDFKFAASVAAFGMVLRDSPYKGNANLENVLEWAKEGKGEDRHGYRQEFIRLIHRAIAISF